MYYAVLDVGGSAIKHALMTKDGDFLHEGSIKTPKYNSEDFIEVIGKIVDDYKTKQKITGLALSLPCAVNPKTGKILGASSVYHMYGTDVIGFLEKRTGLEIIMENDGNCAGLAEAYVGAGKDISFFVTIVIGSGVGGSIIKDKSIIHGKNFHSGEFGIGIIDKPLNEPYGKDISSVASTFALIRSVAIAKNIEPNLLNGKIIFEMANKNDKVVLEQLEKFYKYVATTVYNIQCFIDPEKILIGGGISSNQEFIDGINRHLKDMRSEFFDVEIEVESCKFHNRANLIGALYNFIAESEKR